MYNVYATKGGVEDKSKFDDYHHFPRHNAFEAPTEIFATPAVPIVGGHQCLTAQAKSLEIEPHRLITVRGPSTNASSKDVKDIEGLEDICYVYVRLCGTNNDLVPTPPAVDTRVKLELENSIPQYSQDNDSIFFGHVVLDEEGCSTSCTQFCMLVTAKPTPAIDFADTKLAGETFTFKQTPPMNNARSVSTIFHTSESRVVENQT